MNGQCTVTEKDLPAEAGLIGKLEAKVVAEVEALVVTEGLDVAKALNAKPTVVGSLVT